jgi:thiamine biosynthesis lipoprotein
MTQPPQEINIVSCWPDSISDIHRFSHDAMATVFEIFIIHDDARYAAQAAWAAFDKLDNIEQSLSRFIENSDISQINSLSAHKSLQLGPDAFQCLHLATEIYHQTDGAFDVTIGPLLDCWLTEDKILRTPSKNQLTLARRHTGMNLVELDEAGLTVQLSAGPVLLDLGGIGKGYAVDQMGYLLRDWSIDTALIHSGHSSVLALDAPPQRKGWPVTLTDPRYPKQTLAHPCLRNCSLSGSGLQKGPHIIDPRTAQPVEAKLAAWASTLSAATADALSTAFMVMSCPQTEKYCRRHSDTLAMLVLQDKTAKTQKDKILQFGPWKADNLGD